MAHDPEELARGNIDLMLAASGWYACDHRNTLLSSTRNLLIKAAHRVSGYLL